MVPDMANMEDDPKVGTPGCTPHRGLESDSIVLVKWDSFFQCSWPIYPDRLLQLPQQVSIVLSIHGLAFFLDSNEDHDPGIPEAGGRKLFC